MPHVHTCMPSNQPDLEIIYALVTDKSDNCDKMVNSTPTLRSHLQIAPNLIWKNILCYKTASQPLLLMDVQ